MKIEEGWGMKKDEKWRSIKIEEGWEMKKDEEWRRMRNEEEWGMKKKEEGQWMKNDMTEWIRIVILRWLFCDLRMIDVKIMSPTVTLL